MLRARIGSQTGCSTGVLKYTSFLLRAYFSDSRPNLRRWVTERIVVFRNSLQSSTPLDIYIYITSEDVEFT
jgi:hypothetical protein